VKKEYVILLLAIVVLAIYLVMRPGETDHLDLPQPAALESATIDKIVITRENKPLELVKKDEKWTVRPEGYTADMTQISAMLATVTRLSLSALVAESGNYDRYALSPETKMSVQAFSGDKKVREFDVGQVAPTFQHTFVKLENDPNVYHARGAFKTTFDQTADSLRDKTVLSVDREAIAALVIQKGDKTLTLARKETPAQAPAKPEAPDKPEAKEGQIAQPAPAPEKQWVDDQGKAADREKVDQLIGALSQVQCDGFIKDKTRQDYPTTLWTVTFKTADKSHTISLFAKAKAEEMSYPAASSQSDDIFYLNSGRAETFEKQVDALIAPDQPQAKAKAKP
jgi:hypothetical protein